jgi:hypothetical protein
MWAIGFSSRERLARKWYCGKCGYLNESSDSACGNCYLTRERGAASQHERNVAAAKEVDRLGGYAPTGRQKAAVAGAGVLFGALGARLAGWLVTRRLKSEMKSDIMKTVPGETEDEDDAVER